MPQRIGPAHPPDKSAPAQTQRIDLELQMLERSPVELQLHSGQAQLWTETFPGAAKLHIFSNDPLIPTQTQPRELQIDTFFPEFFEQRRLDASWQPDLVDVNQTSQHAQDQQPERDAQAAEVNPADAPEAPFLRRNHIRGSSGRSLDNPRCPGTTREPARRSRSRRPA